MPNFQASLFDTLQGAISVTLNTECTVLTIVDTSNYDLSDESGHELANFDTYRQLEIKRPNGATFDYDAEGNLDGAWSAPTTANHTIVHTMVEDEADGVYEATLFVAPTYDDTATYTHTASSPKAVYFEGQLYRTIATTTANLPTDTNYWEEIEREDLSAKYRYVATFALTCRKLKQCYEKLVHEANCVIKDNLCDDEILCKNKPFLDAIKLRINLDGISFAAKNQQWEEVKSITNSANKICSC